MSRKNKAPYFVSGDIITDPCTKSWFTVIQLLGRGAFAQCFLVKNSDGFTFAIKVIDYVNVTKQNLLEKIENERLIHRILVHPNIVKLILDFKDSQYVYLVMEYCANGGLDEFIKANQPKLEEIKNWVKQLISALKYMHEEQFIVHRDLKLGNLFLDENYNIKVGDFGLSAVIENNKKKRTLCGTPNYIAPEVIFDKEAGHSFGVDIWAIGVILYILLVGVPPFQKGNIREIYDHINSTDFQFPNDYKGSRYSKDLINRILTRDPDKRPSLDQILEHKFFTKPMNTIESMIFHLSNNLFQEIVPSLDHVCFSLPISRFQAIGYAQASGRRGMFFINDINIVYDPSNRYFVLQKANSDNRSTMKKEEFPVDKVPEKYETYKARLDHFIQVYCKDIPIQHIDPTFVLKVKRSDQAIIICCYNGIMQLEFLCGNVVLLGEEGRIIYAFDSRGKIILSNELKSKSIGILKKIV